MGIARGREQCPEVDVDVVPPSWEVSTQAGELGVQQYTRSPSMQQILFEQYQIPLPPTDLEAIQSIVREQEILSSLATIEDHCDCLTWRRQAAHRGTQVCALFDRNILSDVLSLVRPASCGWLVQCSDRGRIGAAMMAFLQVSNVVIEPSSALYEAADSAPEELRLFRAADNVRPEIYADIALGRRDFLGRNDLPEYSSPLPIVDFHKPITGRKKFYIAVLKIAELELSKRSSVEKMEAFLRWTYDEFLFLPSAILLAASHLTDRRAGSLLKSLRTKDRAKALTNIRNAVWDLQVIQEWCRRTQKQNTENRYWLLCSRDRALKKIARTTLFSGSDADAKRLGLEFFQQHWGHQKGEAIADLLARLLSDKDNPARRANSDPPVGYLDGLVAQLEKTILRWPE